MANSRGRISPRFTSIAASRMLAVVGDALERIKAEDGLSDTDLGAEMGKSPDQAERYRKGDAEMGFTTFVRAISRWDGRVCAELFALIGGKYSPLEPETISDQSSLTAIISLAGELSAELEKDHGHLTADHWRELMPSLDRAGHVIDGLRERPKLKSVR